MISGRHEEANVHDILLKKACGSCGGTLAVRIAPGSGRGVCLGCHLVTTVTVARSGEGVVIAQAPVAEA